jgi:hypothetical protein
MILSFFHISGYGVVFELLDPELSVLFLVLTEYVYELVDFDPLVTPRPFAEFKVEWINILFDHEIFFLRSG